MDADGLPLIGPSVDYSKVKPINQKQTVSLINHFVMHTAGFLNRFSNVCEEKLSHLAVRIQRIETQMTLLEGKISSIPGLEQMVAPPVVAPPAGSNTSQDTPTTQQVAAPAPAQSKPVVEEKQDTEDVQPPTGNTVKQDPRYAKYFKMQFVGVPPMAIKQKMSAEGLNPDLLDTPNALLSADSATNVTTKKAKDDTDFSDEEEAASASDDSSIEFSD